MKKYYYFNYILEKMSRNKWNNLNKLFSFWKVTRKFVFSYFKFSKLLN